MSHPWFEDLNWLPHVWVPQASRLGLHNVAHIVQAHQHYDMRTSRHFQQLPVELRIFQDGMGARHWLRQMRAVPAS